MKKKPDDYIFNTYIPALVKYVVKRDKPTTEKEFVEFAQALYGQVKKEESIKHSA